MEITAEKLHGFVFFWHGEIQPSEIIFSTPQFITDFPALAGTNDLVWEITLYAHSNLAQAYQCAILRNGVGELKSSDIKSLSGYCWGKIVADDRSRVEPPNSTLAMEYNA